MNTIDLELEKKEILKRYRQLLRVSRSKTNKEDKILIRKAFHLAAEAHKDMRRKSGEPYIFHPLEVARIAAEEIGLGATSIICAILHDIVEDTDYNLSDIERMFGSKVAVIIDGLTKIAGIFDHQSSSMQAENFRKVLLTLSEDVRVILLKLADRLHNMRTLDFMGAEKRLKVASETVYLYAPLAHRLGLFAIKSELEDLALKYTEPEIFNTILRKLLESEDERKRFINRFLNPIKRELTKQDFSFKIIDRTKSVNSIWLKMKKKEVPFEEIYDLFAIRIIIDTPLVKEKSDCWRVYSIITDFYHPKNDRLRDWISIPKANGYESLHTTVMSKTGRWVEFQIRTKRMDEIAEKGYAAHWKYKDTITSESGLDEWLNKIREILQDPESSALDFLDEFKMNLFSDEIFVFTPKGELKTLPKNSTVLDFAYSIHTHIGNNAIGGKVNYKLVPLSTKLKSGDQIEIVTSKKQLPKEEWISFATTARAKANIKDALKEERKQFIDEGKQKLHEYFSNYKLEFNNTTIKKFQYFIQTPSLTHFYFKIAKNIITAKEVKEFSSTLETKTNWLKYFMWPFSIAQKTSETKTLPNIIRKKLREKPDTLLLTQDVDVIKYGLANCCKPIPGDDVIAFNLPIEGIQVHRTNCYLAIQMMSTFGNQMVKAKWTKNNQSVSFLTGIKIRGIDKMGLINDLTTVISQELNVNIRSLQIESSEGLFEGVAMLYVQDTAHLNNLIDKLKKVKGIEKIMRVK